MVRLSHFLRTLAPTFSPAVSTVMPRSRSWPHTFTLRLVGLELLLLQTRRSLQEETKLIKVTSTRPSSYTNISFTLRNWPPAHRQIRQAKWSRSTCENCALCWAGRSYFSLNYTCLLIVGRLCKLLVSSSNCLRRTSLRKLMRSLLWSKTMSQVKPFPIHKFSASLSVFWVSSFVVSPNLPIQSNSLSDEPNRNWYW